MKLGLSSYTFTWAVGVPSHLPARPLTALGLLERAAHAGVHVVQFADNLPLDALSAVELDTLQAYAEEHAIQVEVGTRGIAPEHLRRYLDLARRFSSPILRVVLDSDDHHPTPEEATALLAPLQAEFLAAGVTLAIENHDRFPCAVLAGVVRCLGVHWVGVCLDTVNSFGALEGPAAVIDTLGPLVVNLHVKDFTIFRASHRMGFSVEGRPAGQGRLDIPRLLQALRPSPRDFNAILELWTPPEATLAETIAKEEDWAEASLAFLRGLIAE